MKLAHLTLALLLATPVAYSEEYLEFAANGGVINWSQGAVIAEGRGAAPTDGNPRVAGLLACRAAVVDGQRNLLEATQGVRVRAATLVRDFMLKSDEVRSSVEGEVKGASLLSRQIDDQGICTVKMRIFMGGRISNRLYKALYTDPEGSADAATNPLTPGGAKVAFSRLASEKADVTSPWLAPVDADTSSTYLQPDRPEPAPSRLKPAAPDAASDHLEPDGARWTATGRLLLDRFAAAVGRWQLIPAAQAQDPGADWVEAYESLSERVRVLEERLPVDTPQPAAKPARAQATGLVVDARGSNFIPSLSPNIRRLRGGIVYPDPAARESLMDEGRLVALFARDVDFALGHPRVGDRPLLVKGLRTWGDTRTEIVLGQESAETVAALAKTDFFERAGVIIVLD